MAGSILGHSVQRVEDPDLLTGRGLFVADMPIRDPLTLTFVRSPVAHARITGIDVAEAAKCPGIVAVATADDLDVAWAPRVVSLSPDIPQPVLARDKVSYVGEPVVAIVSETATQGADAAELVVIDYDPLPAVVDAEAALLAGAPLVSELLTSNLAAGVRSSNGVDPLGDAEVVVRGRFVNQRMAVAPIEPNVLAIVPGRPEDEFALTAYVATQSPHRIRALICETFQLEQSEVRVVTPYMGGGFGGKVGGGPALAAAVSLARRLHRPIKWVEARSDNLVEMTARAQVQYAELGLTKQGRITGMRCRVISDAGAHGGFGGGLAMWQTYTMGQGPYRIPKLVFDVATALTNTAPTGAFRGAGRPEAASLLERILDMAADELQIDPVEIRRLNYLRPSEFPYRTLTGALYDSGNYELALDKALEIAGYEGLLAEQAARRARNDRCQLGVGIASYVEITAGGGGPEFGSVVIHEDGTVTVRAGTSAHGQGHATSFSMIVSDRLGVPLESIRYVQSDTAVVPFGGGTGGSRSLQMGGGAVEKAARTVMDQARDLAADLLEADVDDIVLSDDGRLGVAGVPARALSWGELATAAAERQETLGADVDFQQPGPTFPFGAHVAVVEVDTETGKVTPLRHVAVDDAGRVINPLIVAGQQHGGIASGMAQALWEETCYDEDGTPVTGTFATYEIPSAAELCSFEVVTTETPTPYNPLGAKGIGEAATVGSTPAIQNAVVDALSHLGVRHVDMPCTPERVWRTIQMARAGDLDDPWREPPPVFEGLPERAGAPDSDTIL